MISDFYSKMKSKLLSAFKGVTPKVVVEVKQEEQHINSNVTSASTIASENKSTDKPINTNAIKEVKSEAVESEKEPITIAIHKPIYEYVHGNKFKTDPTWIVVHYTACINVGAQSMCKAMRNNKDASSHFYIDSNAIYQAVPLEYIAWHVGNGQCKQPDSKKERSLEELTKYSCKDWRYDLAAANHLKWKKNNDDFKGNSCSIGVDICVMKKSRESKKATDTDWYFTDGAVENLAKTVAYLARKYHINTEHIIRHGDATGKLCPQPFVYPPEIGDKAWGDFLDKVAEYMEHEIDVKWVY